MVLLAQSCPTLCDPIDCGPPGPLVHGKNTGVGWHFLLQGIFLIQGLNLCLLNWQADSLPLSHLESLIIIMTAFPGQPLSKYMLSWISFFIHWTVFAVEHQVPTWEWRKLSRAPMSSVMPGSGFSTQSLSDSFQQTAPSLMVLPQLRCLSVTYKERYHLAYNKVEYKLQKWCNLSKITPPWKRRNTQDIWASMFSQQTFSPLWRNIISPKHRNLYIKQCSGFAVIWLRV